MKYFIEFSYNGSNYHGWQKQINANTVQEELTKCISVLLKEEVDLMGAGRTDAGVHAVQMFAHLSINRDINVENLISKLNSFLPNDIYICSLFRVNDNSHARFSAISRTYKYYVNLKKNIFNLNRYLVTKDLDLDKMNESCKFLLGEQDFTSFSKSNTENFTNNCNVTTAIWEKEEDDLVFTISSNRFLRNMVRSIVGTLIDVGVGKIQVNEIKHIIEKKDRCSAGISVPAKALFLTEVKYPKNI